MRETMARYFRVFLIAHLFISINTAIVGQYLEPDAHLTYRSLWGPVMMAFLCILPSFVPVTFQKGSVYPADCDPAGISGIDD